MSKFDQQSQAMVYAIDLASGKTAWQYKIGKLIEYREPISSLVLMP